MSCPDGKAKIICDENGCVLPPKGDCKTPVDLVSPELQPLAWRLLEYQSGQAYLDALVSTLGPIREKVVRAIRSRSSSLDWNGWDEEEKKSQAQAALELRIPFFEIAGFDESEIWGNPEDDDTEREEFWYRCKFTLERLLTIAPDDAGLFRDALVDWMRAWDRSWREELFNLPDYPDISSIKIGPPSLQTYDGLCWYLRNGYRVDLHYLLPFPDLIAEYGL